MSDIIMVKVRDIYDGFHDDNENGCWGHTGSLCIRPEYQRNFCYDEKKQNLVIDTIMKGDRSSLQLFNWVRNDDGKYEIIDGQQRTISICRYLQDKFAYSVSKTDPFPKIFSNLSAAEQQRILDYELIVQVKSFDSDQEKLDFFQRINMKGLDLKKQELLNAAYPGSWITDAKRYFSKLSGPVYTKCMVENKHCSDYMRGECDRQDWLEAVLGWYGGEDIAATMSTHQGEKNAKDLWRYYEDVMDWVAETFIKYRKEMKGLDYGYLYNNFSKVEVDPKELEKRISELMKNLEITKKSGIYYYIFDGDETKLNIRQFPEEIKTAVWEQQECKCAYCGVELEYKDARADHIIPWIKGGHTEIGNCQILCAKCNLSKADH